MVRRLRWNGHVLLYVVRQVVQLRHATPVRHVGSSEDDLDRVTLEKVNHTQRSKYPPLVGARLTDVLVQVAGSHCSSVIRAVIPHQRDRLDQGFSTREIPQGNFRVSGRIGTTDWQAQAVEILIVQRYYP